MKAAEIRTRFLEFFSERGHSVVPSSPVIPHDDPTLLFANAGMNQFKGVFTGQEARDYVRAASSQKCIRAGGKHNDLDNVGYTARHLTFFEMLGNFSFGDYFKSDACKWGWELVTDGFGLDPKDLWVTIFHEDDEARVVWRDEVGVADDRIVGLGEKDNYWSMGDVGPCGPCSEIHIDRGEAHSCGPKCELGVCDCDRYLEFWNLVFMQFEQAADGTKSPLPKPSIDTGMGLERMAMLLQGKESVFETDLIRNLIDRVAELTGVAYSTGPEGTPHRVIADHVRSLSFAIADGAFPSNETRGYVLRRILRRAARYGYKLDADRPFIFEVVSSLADLMGDAYPELKEQHDLIQRLVRSEEEQFGRTLKMGMARFDEEVTQMGSQQSKTFPAPTAFFLHDTCGFPIDLTKQMCREKDLSVDESGFETLMEQQRKRSRAEGDTNDDAGCVVGIDDSIDIIVRRGNVGSETRFFGFDSWSGEGNVVDIQPTGEGCATLVLDATPFYAEGGGQVGDTGLMTGTDFSVEVEDTQKRDGVFYHQVRLASGDLDAIQVGASVQAEIFGPRRLEIQRNHTATHLVHAALREVLGTHVQQKGSLVAPDRLRFDLSHFERIAAEDIRNIEDMVQHHVLENTPIVTGIHDKEEALARGAMAFFGEKYGDKVRVVEIGEFSIELCGGAHCGATGEIGDFRILTESSVSSGVRRIEALTGLGSHRRAQEDQDLLGQLSQSLRAGREELATRIEALIKENRELKSKGGASGRDLLKELDDGAGDRETIGDVEVVAVGFGDAPQEELLRVSDALKQRPGARVYVLGAISDDGVRLLVGSSKDLPKGAVHCGNIAKAGAKIVGGGGGGRPDLAQAGGKDPDQFPKAMEEMRRLCREALTAKA